MLKIYLKEENSKNDLPIGNRLTIYRLVWQQYDELKCICASIKTIFKFISLIFLFFAVQGCGLIVWQSMTIKVVNLALVYIWSFIWHALLYLVFRLSVVRISSLTLWILHLFNWQGKYSVVMTYGSISSKFTMMVVLCFCTR